MRIKENLMSQTFTVNNSDPYLFSLRIMEELSKDVKVVEKKNKYETDGPHHRSVVVFDTVDLVDDFSKILFRFSLASEDGTLRANVTGSLAVGIDETGFFSHVLADYYVKTIFPLLRKISEDKIMFFSSRIEKLFGQASLP